MKRKSAILVVIIIIIIFIFTIFICLNDKKNQKNNKVKEELNFLDKCAYEQVNENWIYYFCISYLKDENNEFNVINEYDFGGYDLLNKDLSDEYGVPVKDKKTGEIIDYMGVNTHALLYGKKTREDTIKIIDYFNSSNFKQENLEEDLKGLNLSNINENIVIKLYNKCLKESDIAFGKYGENPFVATLTHEALNGTIEVGYILYYGNIKFLKIDFIYKDGNHLSDIIKGNDATDKQIEDYNKILSLEEKIVLTQKLDLDDDLEFNEFDVAYLKKLLSELIEE